MMSSIEDRRDMRRPSGTPGAALRGKILHAVVLLLAPACAAPAGHDAAAPEAERPAGVGSAAPTTGSAQGFDLSHHQGEVAWGEVSGQSFVFVKVSEGNDWEDPMFAVNWREARAAGLVRGPYHMFRPEDEVIPQVEFFLSLLQAQGYGKDDLPPALDVERVSSVGHVPRHQIRDRALAWLQEVERRLHRRPLLYTNPKFWASYLEQDHPLAGYPLWIAHYSSAAPPEMAGGWPGWTFWQHTEAGHLPGVAESVDLNRFNGTREALLRFVEGH
jgi:lysozyme